MMEESRTGHRTAGDAVQESTFNVASIQATIEIVVQLEKALNNRVLSNIASAATSAQEDATAPIIRKLRKLHALILADGEHHDIAVTLMRTNLFATISFSAGTILKFASLTDETFRCVLPLLRLPQPLRTTILRSLVSNGGLILSLLALKQYMTVAPSVRVQALEMLAAVLDHVTKADDPANSAEWGAPSAAPAATQRMAGSPGLATHTLTRTPKSYPREAPRRSLVQDATHQMLLHGAASVLCRCLTLSVANLHEISVRRAVHALIFLILETPADLAVKVASFEKWSVLRALLVVMREMTLSSRVDAATLLTGLLASSVQVAEQVHALGAWDELSSVLAQNASIIKVPRHWLRDSLEKIRLVCDVKAGANAGSPHAQQSREPPLRRAEPVFSPHLLDSFPSHLPPFSLDTLDADSLATGAASLEGVVTALLDTHAAVESPAGKPYAYGAATAKQMERQLQRHMAKARVAFSGFGAIQEMYSSQGAAGQQQQQSSRGKGPERPQSGSGSTRKEARAAFFAEASGDRADRAPKREERAYITHLKQSPLGYPVDPQVLRQTKAENGGVVPDYVPQALGGAKMGRRPGAPRSKREKESAQEAHASGAGLPVSSSTGTGTEPANAKKKAAKKDKRALVKGPSAEPLPEPSPLPGHRFVAQRLFNVEEGAVAAARPATASAIDRLSFAERLQCMIMQVKEMT